MCRRTMCLVVVLCVVGGCAVALRLNKIHTGMSKQAVLQAMGAPNYTSGEEGRQFLNYWLLPDPTAKEPEWFYVLLVDGVVESYGRKGDFGTTDTTKKYDIKQDVKIERK